MPSVAQDSQLAALPTDYRDEDTQWFFKSEDLKYTPSRVEGMSYDDEIMNRRKGIHFITQVGISLKLDQITLATASIYFQRFYMRHPLQVGNKGVHHYQIAATSVYVAYKSKENPRKMHELIVAVSRVAQKDPNLMIDDQSKEFWKWRETIQHHENLMLEVLCFDLEPTLPYGILYDYLRWYNVQENKRLRNIAWAVVTDSFTTIMCLLVQPQSTAGAALYIGLKHTGVKLPDGEDGRPWYDVMALDTTEMSMVMDIMLTTYENPNLPRQAPSEAYIRDSESLAFHTTRSSSPPPMNGADQIMSDRAFNDDRSGSEEGELG